jgi:hypothetical protein
MPLPIHCNAPHRRVSGRRPGRGRRTHRRRDGGGLGGQGERGARRADPWQRSGAGRPPGRAGGRHDRRVRHCRGRVWVARTRPVLRVWGRETSCATPNLFPALARFRESGLEESGTQTYPCFRGEKKGNDTQKKGRGRRPTQRRGPPPPPHTHTPMLRPITTSFTVAAAPGPSSHRAAWTGALCAAPPRAPASAARPSSYARRGAAGPRRARLVVAADAGAPQDVLSESW